MEMHIDDTEDECKMTDVEVEDDLNLSSFKELMKRQQYPAPLILSSKGGGTSPRHQEPAKVRDGGEDEGAKWVRTLDFISVTGQEKADAINQEGNGTESETNYLEIMRNVVGPKVSVVEV